MQKTRPTWDEIDETVHALDHAIRSEGRYLGRSLQLRLSATDLALLFGIAAQALVRRAHDKLMSPVRQVEFRLRLAFGTRHLPKPAVPPQAVLRLPARVRGLLK